MEASAATGFNVTACVLALVDAVLLRMNRVVDDRRLTLGKTVTPDDEAASVCVC
jgi:hypothetical protein